MPRPVSEAFLLELHQTDSDNLGVQLAKKCIEAGIPATYAAKAIGVTRLTVYNWFRGKPIRDKFVPVIRAFMKLVDEDLEAGVLPAKDTYSARVYVNQMIGTSS